MRFRGGINKMTLEVAKYNVCAYDTDFEKNGYKYFAIMITEFNGEDREVDNKLIYVLDLPGNDTLEKIKSYCINGDNIYYLTLLPKNARIKLIHRVCVENVY